jgi:hypothetical protein
MSVSCNARDACSPSKLFARQAKRLQSVLVPERKGDKQSNQRPAFFADLLEHLQHYLAEHEKINWDQLLC